MFVPVFVTFCVLKRKIKACFWWKEQMVNQMVLGLLTKGFDVIRIQIPSDSFDTEDDKQREWVQKVISKL